MSTNPADPARVSVRILEKEFFVACAHDERAALLDAAEFLNVQEYKNVQRWADAVFERPAVQRGRMVNRTSGDPSTQLHERHDASDFQTKTQDKLADTSGEPPAPAAARS